MSCRQVRSCFRPRRIEVQQHRRVERPAVGLSGERELAAFADQGAAARIGPPFLQAERNHGGALLLADQHAVAGFRLREPRHAATERQTERVLQFARSAIGRRDDVGDEQHVVALREDHVPFELHALGQHDAQFQEVAFLVALPAEFFPRADGGDPLAGGDGLAGPGSGQHFAAAYDKFHSQRIVGKRHGEPRRVL